MFLIIDNYDSFVFNLADYVHQAGHKTHIAYHDQVTNTLIESVNPLGIIISPGPKHPKDIPNVIDIIHAYAGEIPILGICLGHQAIGYAYGATIGKTSPAHGYGVPITHNDLILFKGLPNIINVGRYHSLSILSDPYFPNCLEITAETNDSIITGEIQHYFS